MAAPASSPFRVSPLMVGMLGVATLIFIGVSPLPSGGAAHAKPGGGGGGGGARGAAASRHMSDASASAAWGGGGGGGGGGGAGASSAALSLSSAASSAGAPALPGPAPPPAPGRPPVDYVWRARDTMLVTYGGRGKTVTVYNHAFPGSTLWPDFWDRVESASWEEDTLNIFEWFLSRDKASVLVDFGSWIGPSVLWGGLFASRVYSIEPDPVSFSTLVANINANPETAAKTSVFWRCIAPKDGDVDMAGSGESNTRMVGVLDTMFLKAGSRWTVPCITLPNFLAEQRIDVAHLQLIKMDTEGTELWLLPTLRPWLESLKDRKPAFWLSVHSPFWLQKKPEELQAAWDVMALFAFVYDQNLKRIYPAKTKPNFEEDFCTFLLSDVEYGGVNAHADLEQKVAKEAAAKAKKV